MRNPDEAIDRVMQGLREAKAPEGMEQRIVTAMRAHAAEEGSVRRFYPTHVGMKLRHEWGTRRPWMWSFGAAGTAAMMLAMVWAHHGVHADDLGRQIATKPQPIAAQPIEKSYLVTNRVKVETPMPKTLIRLAAKAPVVKAASPMSAEEALALREMNAPSMPAPPVPLTEQERLLRRVAYRSDPQELAMLEPEARAAQFEKEKAEVRSFFEPSIKNKGEKE